MGPLGKQLFGADTLKALVSRLLVLQYTPTVWSRLHSLAFQSTKAEIKAKEGSRPAGLANGRAQADKALVARGAPDGVTRVSAHADHGVVG